MADDLEQTVAEHGGPEDANVAAGRPSRRERSQARRQAEELEEQRGRPDPAQDVFTRERLLGREAEQITGHAAHVVAGALHGWDGDEMTRAEVTERIDAYHARQIPPAE